MPTVSAMGAIFFRNETEDMSQLLNTELPKEYEAIIKRNKAEYDEKIKSNQGALQKDVFSEVEHIVHVSEAAKEKYTNIIKSEIKCKLAEYAPDVDANAMAGLEGGL